MSIAFKEWALVCDSLARGEQSIILRKGGIAEGRAGFRFLHGEFLLFPTLYHEQAQKLRLPEGTPVPEPHPEGLHTISLRAQVEWTRDLEDWSLVQALAPFHIWQDFEVEKRFLQDDKRAVSLAFVRIYATTPYTFPDAPKYGGCRSWVEIPDAPADAKFLPVMDNAAHQERQKALLGLLDSQ